MSETMAPGYAFLTSVQLTQVILGLHVVQSGSGDISSSSPSWASLKVLPLRGLVFVEILVLQLCSLGDVVQIFSASVSTSAR